MRADVRQWSEAVTLGDLLVQAARRAPQEPAVVFPGERLTFAELEDRAQTLARGLIGLGVGPRDRVGILMANSPDCVATLFAVALAGAVAVPINTRYRSAELPFVVVDAGLRLVVTSDRIDHHVDLAALLEDALSGLAGAPAVVVLGAGVRPGTVGEAELLDIASSVSEAALEHRRAGARVRDDALLLYTSGTTSSPRGCHLSHEAIVRNWSMVAEVLDLRRGDRCWAPCPLFHLAAIGPLVACVRRGAVFVSDTWFDPGRAVALLREQRVTHLYPAYPPITQGLLQHATFRAGDLHAARVMLNVGPPDLLRAMQAAVPQVVQLSLYGSTEGGGAITFGSRDDGLDARVGTCGLPMPGTDVRIADGEIQVRSPVLFDGYNNDAGKTAAAFTADGFYRTGDRGELDASGRLRFLGRLKDMLKVGGENVAPAEIESLLATHPAVKLAQVVGVPDERLEEVPAAFVELRADTQASEADLIAFCAGRIAGFKVPRHVRLVTSWPMSATKIQKGPLRDGLVRELAGA